MLSGDERQRLRDIELGLRREDPMFAATMQSWQLQRPPDRRRNSRRLMLIVLAVVLVLGAVVLGLLL